MNADTPDGAGRGFMHQCLSAANERCGIFSCAPTIPDEGAGETIAIIRHNSSLLCPFPRLPAPAFGIEILRVPNLIKHAMRCHDFGSEREARHAA
jgi:hypothetical protein